MYAYSLTYLFMKSYEWERESNFKISGSSVVFTNKTQVSVFTKLLKY